MLLHNKQNKIKKSVVCLSLSASHMTCTEEQHKKNNTNLLHRRTIPTFALTNLASLATELARMVGDSLQAANEDKDKYNQFCNLVHKISAEKGFRADVHQVHGDGNCFFVACLEIIKELGKDPATSMFQSLQGNIFNKIKALEEAHANSKAMNKNSDFPEVQAIQEARLDILNKIKGLASQDSRLDTTHLTMQHIRHLIAACLLLDCHALLDEQLLDWSAVYCTLEPAQQQLCSQSQSSHQAGCTECKLLNLKNSICSDGQYADHISVSLCLGRLLVATGFKGLLMTFNCERETGDWCHGFSLQQDTQGPNEDFHCVFIQSDRIGEHYDWATFKPLGVFFFDLQFFLSEIPLSYV